MASHLNLELLEREKTMSNHQHEIIGKIEICEYGYRKKFLGKVKCGNGEREFLHISEHPKKKHSAYRILKLIEMMPYCTKKEILWATNGNGAESTHGYWSDLHRKGYIEQFRTTGNLIVYALTKYGEDFIHKAEQ